MPSFGRYYLRKLPLGVCRGRLMKFFLFVNRFICFLSLLTLIANVLWLFSAIYFKPKFVTDLLTAFGSVGYAGHVS